MRLTRAEIDLTALRHNFERIRTRVGSDVSILGVVKANAYGHGSAEIGRTLERCGCDYLGVAFLEEGIVLREHGVSIPILVLGGLLGGQIQDFLKYNLDVAISSVGIAEQVHREVLSAGGKKARVHLKIDTGMERIGVRAEHAFDFVRRVCELARLDAVGIFSHLATSDEHDKSFAHAQLQKFRRLIEMVEGAGIRIPLKHIANSGAILDLPESYFSMVRPGMMLYGYYPSKATSESVALRPLLSLKSKVVYLKEVPGGRSVSYGRTFYTAAATTIATVPIGYGDGYSCRLSNRTEVLIGGRRYPAVGTICMDHLMVDVGRDANIAIGDDVILIGRDGKEAITCWDLADRLGTIPYEVLTGINERVPRRYINSP